MTSDVVLSAALRSNLLSLQSTQNQVDITQNRLATGRKVNSALDNPQSYFASQALTNRASDLTRLLDNIGQSIQVIKAADNGVTALTKLVEQADSIASQARDALAQGTAEAKVTGNVDLRGVDSLPALAGITAGDVVTFSIVDEEGRSRNIGAYGGAAAATASITLNANFSSDDLVTAINDLSLEATIGSLVANGDKAFTASLDAGGKLEIIGNDGSKFAVRFGAAVTAATEPARLALAQALGFGEVAQAQAADTAATDSIVGFTASSNVALQSFALYDNSVPASRSIAQRGDMLSVISNSSGTALFGTIDAATDDYQIGINGGTMQNIELFAGGGAVTIQEFIDQINNNTNLNAYIRADFDDATGVLSIEATSEETESIQIGVAASIVTANFGFGVNAAFTGTAAIDESENILLSGAAGTLAGLEDEFDNIRDQITQLVSNGDTGYRGTNLLNGDDLLSVFNETRTSSLNTEGVTFTADGLGLDEAIFSRASSVDGVIAQVREALEAVRAFGSTLANDLSIIQTRQTFTTGLINTLKEGSDKLINADQNEEGAKLLALQTRQSLGVTALSLASQSQQSILRLF
jgi:flagellin